TCWPCSQSSRAGRRTRCASRLTARRGGGGCSTSSSPTGRSSAGGGKDGPPRGPTKGRPASSPSAAGPHAAPLSQSPKHIAGPHLPPPKAELLRGRVVTVDSDTAVPVELDGEQPGTTPARFEAVPGRLRLRVPRSG